MPDRRDRSHPEGSWPCYPSGDPLPAWTLGLPTVDDQRTPQPPFTADIDAEQDAILQKRIGREDQTSRWRPVAGHGERKDREIER